MTFWREYPQHLLEAIFLAGRLLKDDLFGFLRILNSGTSWYLHRVYMFRPTVTPWSYGLAMKHWRRYEWYALVGLPSKIERTHSTGRQPQRGLEGYTSVPLDRHIRPTHQLLWALVSTQEMQSWGSTMRTWIWASREREKIVGSYSTALVMKSRISGIPR